MPSSDIPTVLAYQTFAVYHDNGKPKNKLQYLTKYVNLLNANWPWNLYLMRRTRPSGGMADAGDLKSPAHYGRVGSNPTLANADFKFFRR